MTSSPDRRPATLRAHQTGLAIGHSLVIKSYLMSVEDRYILRVRLRTSPYTYSRWNGLVCSFVSERDYPFAHKLFLRRPPDNYVLNPFLPRAGQRLSCARLSSWSHAERGTRHVILGYFNLRVFNPDPTLLGDCYFRRGLNGYQVWRQTNRKEGMLPNKF